METRAAFNSAEEKESSAATEMVLPEGVDRVSLRIDVPVGVRLAVDIEARTQDGRVFARHQVVLSQAAASRSRWDGVFSAGKQILYLARAWGQASEAGLAIWLTWAALAVYLIVRLVGLPSFPIYFFTDEAVQTNLAADFLRDGLRGSDHQLLPTYFQNGSQYNLGVSVYLQVIPYFFFGKSVWVTRGIAVLATFIAAVSTGLMMKRIFHSHYAWLGVLSLSVTPVWFLHSRTAFETSLSVSFFAAFLFCYLCYRCETPRYLYGAVVFGALSFYSYSAARIVIPAAAFFLLVSDWRYHWAQRATVLRAFGLALLLAVPFARFLWTHPEASHWQMRLLGSVWTSGAPLFQKVTTSLSEYLRGLSPLYWFLPQSYDLPRHTMLGYGHLLRHSLPMALFGIGLALRNVRSPAYRTLLIAVLAAPAGAAAVKLGVTRAMFMVIPAAILTALGTAAILEWSIRRFFWSRKVLAGGVFLLMVSINGYMLVDALTNGPLWYRDYGLAGMQYGARQVFDEIRTYLDENPDAHVVLSPSWANGTDVIARFFFSDPLPFELGSVSGYYLAAKPLDDNQMFVMLPEEFNDLPEAYFSDISVEKTLPYPDGRVGFYFVHLKYSDQIQELIAEEQRQRHELVSARVQIDGQPATVQHTQLDLGETRHMFDGDLDTMSRTWAVNPMLLEINLDTPRQVGSISLRIGGTATQMKLLAWPEGVLEPVEMNRQLGEEPLPRLTQFELPAGQIFSRFSIEIWNTNDTEEGHVHLWEVSFH